MALLPAWVPTEAALIALVVTLAAILLMNRGSPWFINAKAQDEPLLVGIGVFLVLAAGWLAGLPVLEVVPTMLWWAAGALAVAVGVLARYTELLDIEGLV